MAVNVKMGVDIGGFTSGIKQGQQILKGLNAEMKASEAEFKATGNAEKKLNDQTKTLNSQLNVQKGIADQAKKALEAMTKAGIDPADAAYQKLYVQMLNAEAGANEAQAALSKLGGGAEQAAEGADQLSNSLNGISKKMSLEQVIGGIDKITSGLENAAKKAIKLGEDLFNAITEAAGWADDTATQAEMFGIDIDTFQRMQKLVTNGMDTTVESMLKSQKRMRKGIGEESKATIEALEQLGLAISSGKDQTAHLITEDQTELFWKAGKAIMALSDDFDKEAKAQALFGRSWEELVPLFNKYKSAEDYAKALEEVEVVSTESVENLATLNDKLSELEGNFDTLKKELLGELAPALTDAAEALNGLLTSLLDYLKTDEGKQMLADLGTAVSGLFDDLKKIDPDQVVEGFTGVFNTVVDSIKWISDNWEGVVTALKGIVIGWGALKITGGILDIVKIVEGLSGLGGGSAASAGAAAGSAWGGAFAKAVIAAAPWLIGLYTLLNPASTASDNLDLAFANGQVTEGGYDFWKNNMDQWDKRLGAVGSRYGDLGTLINTPEALNIIANPTIDDEEMFRQLEAIGVVPIPSEIEIAEDTAAQLSKEIGTVEINGVVHFVDENGNNIGADLGGGTPTGTRRRRTQTLPGHANGLFSVPYDGYLAMLHKNERVVPAREVSSRNYSSNLYVESMYMNGGTDAAGLAAAMAAAQRRQMSGYGS